MVAKPGREAEVIAICEKWDIERAVVGKVTDTARFVCTATPGYDPIDPKRERDPQVFVDIPVGALTDETPVCDGPQAEPPPVGHAGKPRSASSSSAAANSKGHASSRLASAASSRSSRRRTERTRRRDGRRLTERTRDHRLEACRDVGGAFRRPKAATSTTGMFLLSEGLLHHCPGPRDGLDLAHAVALHRDGHGVFEDVRELADEARRDRSAVTSRAGDPAAHG